MSEDDLLQYFTSMLLNKDSRIQYEMLEAREGGSSVLRLHRASLNSILAFSPAFFMTVRRLANSRLLDLSTHTYNEEVIESRLIDMDELLKEDVYGSVVQALNRSYRVCEGLVEEKVSDRDVSKLLIERYSDRVRYRSRQCFRVIKDSFQLEDVSRSVDLCPSCLCFCDLGLKIELRNTGSTEDEEEVEQKDTLPESIDSYPDLPDYEEEEEFTPPKPKKLKKNGRVERLSCPEENCKKTFKGRRALLKHTAELHSGTKSRCPVPTCSKLFKQPLEQRRLLLHFSKAHATDPDSSQYIQDNLGSRCGTCEETLGSLEERQEHEKSCRQPSTCELCGQIYSSASTLKVHKRTLHSDECFECDVPGCGRRVKTKASLLDHKSSVHNNQKMYMCHGCGKDFRYRHQRRMCENKHMGKFIHPCVLCDKKFNDKRRFDQHMRVHTGEKPFMCPICSFRCARLDNLNLHCKKSHKMSWKEAETMTGVSCRSSAGSQPEVARSQGELNLILEQKQRFQNQSAMVHQSELCADIILPHPLLT